MTYDRKDYLQAEVAGASPVGLVVLLYDRLIMDLTRALAAIDRGDIEARAGELNHAFLILGQLEGSLDAEHAPESAQTQALFYNMARSKILEAHLKTDRKLLEQQVALFNEVRSAWEQIDPVRKAKTPLAPTLPIAATGEGNEELASLDASA